MEYPHRQYLIYLLSRQMTPYEIRADCTVKDLIPPTDEYLMELANVLGNIPSYWRAKVTRGNIPFRRWLRNKGILSGWKKTPMFLGAVALLGKGQIRRDFEAIVLAHGDISRARRELDVKYLEGMVPEVEVLEEFYRLFWDLGSMTGEGIFTYLETSKGREDYQHALKGDLTTTYALLGLQQRVSYERLMQAATDMAFNQIHYINANPTLTGAAKAGADSLIKTGIGAAEMLRQTRILNDEEDSPIRKDAADFMVRRLPTRAIPSIEDLTEQDGVIDADYEDAEVDNVRRLPVHILHK